MNTTLNLNKHQNQLTFPSSIIKFLKTDQTLQIPLIVVFFYPPQTAVDIFAATSKYEVMSIPGSRTIIRGRDDMCHQIENLCSIPAGGKGAN